MTIIYKHKVCCFIRISMNNLKDIHNAKHELTERGHVVLSGFQWTIWRIYTTGGEINPEEYKLFYQDFNEQFEGYTQPVIFAPSTSNCCFIRISMNNLKDIHNTSANCGHRHRVVLSGFQWTIWRIYTTSTKIKW